MRSARVTAPVMVAGLADLAPVHARRRWIRFRQRRLAVERSAATVGVDAASDSAASSAMCRGRPAPRRARMSEAVSAVSSAPSDAPASSGARQRRRRPEDRDVGRRLRRHGRPGRRGQGRGHAQRDRAAAGLGQLRRDHQGVPDQVPGHQDRPAAAGRLVGAGDPGRARRTRAPTRRRTCSTSAHRSRWPALAIFAPYKVATSTRSRPSNKDPDGAWVNDYTGLMSVGYNADQVRRDHLAEPADGPEVQGSRSR